MSILSEENQAMPAEGPASPEAPVQGGGSYPQNSEEAGRARVNLVRFIRSEKLQPKLVKLLTGDPQRALPEMAKLIALMIARIIAKIKGQFGKKVHMVLVDMLIKLAIQEVSRIAAKIGVKEMPKQASNMFRQEIVQAMVDLKKKKNVQPEMEPPPEGMLPAGGSQPNTQGSGILNRGAQL